MTSDYHGNLTRAFPEESGGIWDESGNNLDDSGSDPDEKKPLLIRQKHVDFAGRPKSGRRRKEMTEARLWPNVCRNVRDDSAEVVRIDIEKLERITMNLVNDEEGIETIAAEVIHDLHLVLRSLEKVDAATDPIGELGTKVHQLKHSYQGA